jgi:hypothetical protein
MRRCLPQVVGGCHLRSKERAAATMALSLRKVISALCTGRFEHAPKPQSGLRKRELSRTGHPYDRSLVVGRQLVEEQTRRLGRTGTVAHLVLHG